MQVPRETITNCKIDNKSPIIPSPLEPQMTVDNKMVVSTETKMTKLDISLETGSEVYDALGLPPKSANISTPVEPQMLEDNKVPAISRVEKDTAEISPLMSSKRPLFCPHTKAPHVPGVLSISFPAHNTSSCIPALSALSSTSNNAKCAAHGVKYLPYNPDNSEQLPPLPPPLQILFHGSFIAQPRQCQLMRWNKCLIREQSSDAKDTWWNTSPPPPIIN